MYASAFVLGFHGCDEEVGEAVLSGQVGLKPSTNDYDWLGHGVYFWENSPKRAMAWAQYVHANPRLFRTKINRPFVVGAVINFVHALRAGADADGRGDRSQVPFDSVRGAFSEGKPLYTDARIMAQTHIQLCVRNPKSIRGYFRPIVG